MGDPRSRPAPSWGDVPHPLPLIILLTVAAAVYSTTLDYELSFDDPLFFEPEAESYMTTGLHRLFSSDYFGLIQNPAAPSGTPYYRPLPLGVMVLERMVFGNSVRAFRTFHFALHLLNILLMFTFAKRVLERAPGGETRTRAATVAAAMFAFSPFTVDTVLLLAALCDIMAFGLAATALLAFLSWLERRSIPTLVLIALASAGAMLSKESAFALPVAMTALCLPLRDTVSRPRAVSGIAAGVVSAAAVYALRAQVISVSVFASALQSLPYMPSAIALAARTTFIPVSCPLEVSVSPEILAPLFWIGALFFAAVTLLLFRFHKQATAAFIGTSIWFSFLLPSLAALSATEIFAPRYLYLPALGSSLLAGAATRKIGNRKWRYGVYIVLSVFAVLTAARTVVWKDGVTLWMNELENNRDSLSAHINLGNELQKRGRFEEAFALELGAAALASAKHRPCAAASAEINAANILLHHSNESHRALALFESGAGRCREKSFAAWMGIATLHARNRELKKAEDAARRALRGAPHSPDLQVFLGGLLLMQGQSAEATQHFSTARRLTRADPTALADVDRRVEAAKKQAEEGKALQGK